MSFCTFLELCEAFIPALDHLAAAESELKGTTLLSTIENGAIEKFASVVNLEGCSLLSVVPTAFLSDLNIKLASVDWLIFGERCLEVLCLRLLIRLDRACAWLPVRRAHFTNLISILESLDQTQGLVNGATDGVIIDLHRAYLFFGVNEEETSKSCAKHGIVLIFNKNSKVTRDIL